MKLSERAISYLRTQSRDQDWVTTIEETRNYLLRKKLNNIDKLLEFQLLYSGYSIAKMNKPKDTFQVRLFSKADILSDRDLEYIEKGNRILFNCVDHYTAQFTFYISDRGELCTLDDADNVNILAESFDTKVEQYALNTEIADWFEHPYFYELPDMKKLETHLTGFNLIKECSDKYNKWLTNGRVLYTTGIWLDRPESYLHIYWINKNECDQQLEFLKANEIIKLK